MKKLLCFLLSCMMVPCAFSFAAAEEEPKTQYRYKKCSLEVPVGERTIRGVLYMPKNADHDVPVAICCHGYTGTYTTFQYLCDQLARKGVAVAAFDFYGGSVSSISGGSMLEMSVETEQEELDAVLDEVVSREGINAEQCFILGHSQGGYVCTLEATRHPEKVAAMFLYAPAFHIAETMTAMFPDQDNIPERTQIGAGSIGPKYVLDVWGTDIYAEMSKYTGPVEIVHGDADSDVPVSYSERAVEAFPNAHLTVIEGMDHSLPDSVADVLITKVMEKVDASK
jgi:uncharacterized protein